MPVQKLDQLPTSTGLIAGFLNHQQYNPLHTVIEKYEKSPHIGLFLDLYDHLPFGIGKPSILLSVAIFWLHFTHKQKHLQAQVPVQQLEHLRNVGGGGGFADLSKPPNLGLKNVFFWAVCWVKLK